MWGVACRACAGVADPALIPARTAASTLRVTFVGLEGVGPSRDTELMTVGVLTSPKCGPLAVGRAHNGGRTLDRGREADREGC